MGKFKNYIYSNAETQVDNISNDYAKGNIALDVAVDKIKKVDNFEMIVEEHNIEDVFLCKRRLLKKQMLKGDRSSEQ